LSGPGNGDAATGRLDAGTLAELHRLAGWQPRSGREAMAKASALRTIERLLRQRPPVNRGIGPVAGLLGALAAFEALRYLTGFEPPAYAGRPLIIDFAAGCATEQVQWHHRSDCAACSGVPVTARPTPNDRRGEEVIRI